MFDLLTMADVCKAFADALNACVKKKDADPTNKPPSATWRQALIDNHNYD
jgi:hypothetical protein